MLFAGGPRWWGAVVSAASPIALGSSSGSLTLTLDENGVGGWCHVHLLVSGICTPLGAEALSTSLRISRHSSRRRRPASVGFSASRSYTPPYTASTSLGR